MPNAKKKKRNETKQGGQGPTNVTNDVKVFVFKRWHLRKHCHSLSSGNRVFKQLFGLKNQKPDEQPQKPSVLKATLAP